MGNGPSNRIDFPKPPASNTPLTKPPSDASSSLAAVGQELIGSGALSGANAEGSFCTRPQVAEFRAIAEVEPHTSIKIVIGDPPQVRSSAGTLIGELLGQTAAAIRSCLELDYVMKGDVETRIEPGDVGQVIVVGER